LHDESSLDGDLTNDVPPNGFDEYESRQLGLARDVYANLIA